MVPYHFSPLCHPLPFPLTLFVPPLPHPTHDTCSCRLPATFQSDPCAHNRSAPRAERRKVLRRQAVQTRERMSDASFSNEEVRVEVGNAVGEGMRWRRATQHGVMRTGCGRWCGRWCREAAGGETLWFNVYSGRSGRKREAMRLDGDTWG